MHDWLAWEVEKRTERTAEALEQNGFKAEIVRDRDQAAARVEVEAEGAATVGFGGSLTLMELDLPSRLAAKGHDCLLHGIPGLSPEERVAIMRRQLTCDLFLTSANAVTLDGMLVNIDANGNRVAAMTFGPRKTVVVAGFNKLADNVEDALRRIKAWAAPANAHRLDRKTPCATTGFCCDCDSPERICRVVHVMERRPPAADIRVILVKESLGL